MVVAQSVTARRQKGGDTNTDEGTNQTQNKPESKREKPKVKGERRRRESGESGWTRGRGRMIRQKGVDRKGGYH